MNKVQTKRLLNVARALREAHAAKKKFDMTTFVFGTWGDVESNFNYETNKNEYCNREENFCGTPACALGHYASRTDLQRLLKVAFLKDKDRGNVLTAQLAFFGEKPERGMTCPDYGDEKFEKHFGLDYDEMDELFGGGGCGCATTALQAAKYIEKFVKVKQFPGRSSSSSIW